VYRCEGEDQWVAVVCRTDAERAALAGLVGAAGMAREPESWWEDHLEEVDAAIAAWTSARAKAACLRELGQAGVTAAPVLSAKERAEDPHFRRRRVFLDGARRQKGFPLRLFGYEPPQPRPAPRIGEHDAEVRSGRWPGAAESTDVAEPTEVSSRPGGTP
ncbi:MAG: CoA transferase, partial [Pseudonocardia sp.]